MPEELEPVPCPWEIKYLWGWFIDISRGRNYSGMGAPLPISHNEIKAWQDLTKITMEKWELEAIKAIDDIKMSNDADQIKKRSKPGSKKP